MIKHLLNNLNLSNNKIILKIRTFMLRTIFNCKKMYFKVVLRLKDISINNTNIIKKTIKFIIKSILAIYVIDKIDIYFMQLLKIEVIQLSELKEIIVANLGIIGVVLGLYCSSLDSIFSENYTQVTENVADLFRNDKRTQRTIKLLISDIVISLILLLKILFNNVTGYITIVFYVILTFYTVIQYAYEGRNTNVLSCPYSLAYNIYSDIVSIFDIFGNNRNILSDRNFQVGINRICVEKISLLSELSRCKEYNRKSDSIAIVEFMIKNYLLLAKYESIKNRIEFNSEWFSYKTKYKKWHKTDYMEINIATQTGTTIDVDRERNRMWFEEEIKKINDDCFYQLCKNMDIKSLNQYLNKLNVYVDSFCYTEELSFIYKMLKDYEKEITRIVVNNKENNRNIEITSLVENMTLLFSTILLSVFKRIRNLNIEKEINQAIKDIKKHEYYLNHYLNNIKGEKLNASIMCEIDIEKKQITPEWFIKEIVAEEIYNEINTLCKFVYGIQESLLNIAKELNDSKMYVESLIVLMHLLEDISKTKSVYSYFDKTINSLIRNRVNTSRKWNKSLYDELKKNIRRIELKFYKEFSKGSIVFTLENWQTNNIYPDFLGYYYNQTCTYLVNCICENDYKAFSSIYKGFINTVLFYNEYIRVDVIDEKINKKYNYIIDRISIPFFEYSLISGFAIIMGEFIKDKKWRKLVENELKEFYEKTKTNNTLEKIVDFIKGKEQLLLGSRDVIEIEWAQKVTNAINKSGFVEYEQSNPFNKSIKTNSRIISSFCGNEFIDFGLKTNCYEVYLIICVNNYLDNNKKYRSRYNWERKL